MTLKDLADRFETAKITYKYGLMPKDTKPPYAYAIVSDSNNFIADNIVYKKIDSIELYYIFSNKDIEIEETIENTILGDIAWRKGDETYYRDEEVWEVIYYFNI